jgi:hypothetical protein
MSTFFEVLGFLCFSVFVAFAIGALWFAWKVRRVVKTVEGLAQEALTPTRVHLARVLGHEWRSPRTEGLSAPLAALGFEDAGRWAIDEVSGLVVQLLVQREARVIAAVHERAGQGSWLDLVTRYEDGGSTTYTTGAPGPDRVAAPGASPEALYQRLLDERPKNRAVKEPGGPEEAKAVYESAWTEEMAKRGFKPGPSAADLRSAVKSAGFDLRIDLGPRAIGHDPGADDRGMKSS